MITNGFRAESISPRFSRNSSSPNHYPKINDSISIDLSVNLPMSVPKVFFNHSITERSPYLRAQTAQQFAQIHALDDGFILPLLTESHLHLTSPIQPCKAITLGISYVSSSFIYPFRKPHGSPTAHWSPVALRCDRRQPTATTFSARRWIFWVKASN